MSVSFSPEFLKAFNFTMKYEVGPWYNHDDPDVKAGLCDTKERRRKTGYVNDIDDRGGETKFGIAKNSHPNIDIKTLTLDVAMSIYQTDYWNKGRCNELPALIGICHFDACVNHGIGRAVKMLQEALSCRVDGACGPGTISAAKDAEETEILQKLFLIRERFFKNLALNKPSNSKFLKGWLARVDSIKDILM